MDAISKLQIINMSLDLIDERSLNSIDNPRTITEQLMVRHFDQRRRAFLRKHTWNFATRRTSLPPLSESVPFGEWDNWYQLPTDYLRFCSLGEFYSQLVGFYQIEDSRILTRNIQGLGTGDDLPLRYVFDHTNYPKYDPLAIDCLTYELAIFASAKITGKETIRRSLRKEYQDDVFPEAAAIDGQDRPPIKIERSRAIAARSGHGMGTRADRAYFP